MGTAPSEAQAKMGTVPSEERAPRTVPTFADPNTPPSKKWGLSPARNERRGPSPLLRPPTRVPKQKWGLSPARNERRGLSPLLRTSTPTTQQATRANHKPPRHALILSVLLLAAAGCAPSPHDIAASGDVERMKARLADDPESIHARNDLEKTPLHYAVTSSRTEMIAYLIAQGADIAAADRTGMQPLHVAIVQHAPDRPDQIAQLLDAGAGISAQDDFGDTPLHVAAMFGKLRILKYLIERGADPAAKNVEGLTPQELARKHRRTEAAELLDAD